MICIFCKGKVSKKVVEEEVKVENNHVMVEVEAEVCESCHERYFPQGTIDYLLKVKRELKAGKKNLKLIGKVFQAA
jgi:YgiT-type zinc finger domain-containing protein